MAKTTRLAGIRVDLSMGIANFTRGIDDATRQMQQMQKKFEAIGSTLGKAFGALGAGVLLYGIKQLSSAIGDLAQQGEVAGSIAENFEKLGGSSAQIDVAKQNVLGLLDSFELMQIANQGLIAGVKDFGANFGQVAEFAARYADAIGIDTKQALEGITEAISKGAVKELNRYGFEIEKTTDKTKIWTEVNKQLPDVIARLAPATDSVANAQDALGKKWEEGLKIAGMAINSNEELTAAYRELGKALDEIDWTAIGEALATIQKAFVNFATTISQIVLPEIENLARGFNYLFGSGKEAQADRMAEEITSMKERLKELTQDTNLASMRGWAAKEAEEIKQKLPVMEEAFKKLKQELDGVATGSDKAAKGGQAFTRGNIEAGKSAKKAADEIEKLNKKWKDSLSENNENSLKKQLDNAVETLNTADFTRLQEQLRRAVEEGFVKEWEDAIKLGAVSEAEVRAEGKKVAQTQADEYGKEFKKKNQEIAANLAKEFATAFDDLSNIFGGVFDRLGTEFGDIFSTMGEVLGDETKAGITKGLADFLGTDSAGLKAYAETFSTIITSALDAKAIDKASQSNKGTGGAIGAAGGGVLGHIIGGPEGAAIGASIGNALGGALGSLIKWGPQNADTQSRKKLSGALEDLIKAIGGLKFFDEKGNPKLVNDVKARPFGDFNDPNWPGQYSQKFGKQTADQFSAIGNAIGIMFGDANTKLEQVGPMLAESLGGSLEGLKALLQGVGVTFEDMEKKLVEAGKQGKLTWLEVESAIAKTGEALKPGLKAVGAFNQAFENLLQSGARGQIALNQLKNIAVEAKEAGVKSLEDLKQRLVASGKFDKQAIDGLFSALSAFRIKSFDDLLKASDRTLGAIIANMQAAGVKFQDGFKPLQETLESINKMPDTIEKELKFKVTADISPEAEEVLGEDVEAVNNIKKTAGAATLSLSANGIKQAAQAGMMGKLDPAALTAKYSVSSARVSSVRSSMAGRGNSGVTLVVNAQGADAGVEARIMDALASVHRSAVESAIDVVRGAGY